MIYENERESVFYVYCYRFHSSPTVLRSSFCILLFASAALVVRFPFLHGRTALRKMDSEHKVLYAIDFKYLVTYVFVEQIVSRISVYFLISENGKGEHLKSSWASAIACEMIECNAFLFVFIVQSYDYSQVFDRLRSDIVINRPSDCNFLKRVISWMSD